MEDQLIISFPEESEGQANILAQDLKEALEALQEVKEAETRRADPTSQDFGATLGIILGSGAAVAIAQGIKAWLTRHHSVTLRIERPDGTVVMENLTAAKAVKLAEKLMAD